MPTVARRRRLSRKKGVSKRAKPKVHVSSGFLNNREIYDSDIFFKTCLQQVVAAPIDSAEDIEYYVVLDKVYKHDPEVDLDHVYESHYSAMYEDLKMLSKTNLPEHAGFSCLVTSKFIRYVTFYEEDTSVSPVVKTCVTLDKNFQISVLVHGCSLPKEHSIYSEIFRQCCTIKQLKSVLECVAQYKVCSGNNDECFQSLLQVVDNLDGLGENSRAGFKENIYGSTIRSTKCHLLIKSNRCAFCSVYRRTLTKTLWRIKKKESMPAQEINWMQSTAANKLLSPSQKNQKLKQMKLHLVSLESEIQKLRREVQKHKNNDMKKKKNVFK